jgi:hypothetical protein
VSEKLSVVDEREFCAWLPVTVPESTPDLASITKVAKVLTIRWNVWIELVVGLKHTNPLVFEFPSAPLSGRTSVQVLPEGEPFSLSLRMVPDMPTPEPQTPTKIKFAPVVFLAALSTVAFPLKGVATTLAIDVPMLEPTGF